MLNVLRENLKHLKILLWVVAFSMILYLGAYFSCGGPQGGANATWVARVNGEAIPVAKFYSAVRSMDDYNRQFMGEQYEKFRPQLRLGSQVVQRMVDERIQIHEARRLGLQATPSEIARFIQNEPSLRDSATGQFIGREKYLQAFRSSGRNVEEFEQAVADMITIRKWTRLVGQTAEVMDPELEQAYRSSADRTRVDFAVVPSAKQKVDPEISESEVAAWYRGHQSDYRRGEARRVRYLVVERQAQLGKVQVSDDDVQSFFNANQADYPEQTLEQARDPIRRRLEQQRAQEKAQAEAERIRGTIQSPGDLQAAAVREGLEVEEASVSRDDRLPELGPSPQFLDAVFSLDGSAVSSPVGVARGFAILTAGEKLPASVRPLEEIRDRVRTDILNDRSRRIARAAAADALAKNKTVADAAKALEVEVRSDVDARPKQSLPGTGGTSPEIERALFGPSVAIGDTGAVPVPSGALLYVVKEIERYDPSAFQAKKEELRAAAIQQKQGMVVQAVLEKLRGKYTVERNQEIEESANQ